MLLWVLAGVFFENSVVTGIFFEFALLEFHMTILFDVFFLVYPYDYVILMFVLKGSFTDVFSRHSCSLRQVPRRKRSASSP